MRILCKPNRILHCATLTLMAWMLLLTKTYSQPRCEIFRHSELHEIANSVNRLLQTQDGMLWLATTNGLYRYDGYDYANFKSHVGDGLNTPSDNIRNIFLNTNDAIWCLIERRVLLFDTRRFEYVNVLADLEKTLGQAINIVKIRSTRNGTSWLLTDDDKAICVDDSMPESSARIVLQGVGKIGSIIPGANGQTWLLAQRQAYIYHRHNRLSLVPIPLQTVATTAERTWVVTTSGKLCYYDEQHNRIKRYGGDNIPKDIIHLKTMTGDRLAIITKTHLCVLHTKTGRLLCDDFTYETKDIREDADGNLWILSREGMLLCFKNGILSKSYDVSMLYHPHWHIDQKGTMWFVDGRGEIYYIEKDAAGPVRHPASSPQLAQGLNFLTGNHDNVWFRGSAEVYRLSFRHPEYARLPLQQPEQIRSSMTDRLGYTWVAGKEYQTVRRLDKAGLPAGFLGSDGQWHEAFTVFGKHVYSMLQDRTGTIWLGCKPEGLYRLTPQTDGSYKIRHIDELSNEDLYDLAEDGRGRLWVATLNGGINCITDAHSDHPKVLSPEHGLKGYGKALPLRATCLHITQRGILLAGTREGLLVADINGKEENKVTFIHHQREADRETSLSCSAINHVFEDSKGRIFLCTESGGVNEVMSASLLTPKLDFRHYDQSTGLGTDCTKKMFETADGLWVVTANKLICFSPDKGKQPEATIHLQHDNLVFSDAAPLKAPWRQGAWLLGLADGAIVLDTNRLRQHSRSNAPLVVTSVSIDGGKPTYDTYHTDSIIVPPGKNSVAVSFATLHYSASNLINYAFRMGEGEWIYLGTAHAVMLSDLGIGKHTLQIRSTDGEGAWGSKTRTVTIIVKPTFWQSAWGIASILLILLTMAAGIAYTYHYVRHIKRKHRELLEVYLRLVNSMPAEEPDHQQEQQHQEVIQRANITPQDDAFMKKAVEYVRLHMADSDLNMDTMASELATSRSGLNRKIKQFFGITPVELLRNARLRHASELLLDRELPINEVAYSCGFSDPKYFSKCFKTFTGKTPSEYREGV